MASTSRYRKELLSRLGLTFSCIAPGVDETAHPGEAPGELVARLARAKASAVSVQQPDAWVIGSDQIAVLDGPQARRRSANQARRPAAKSSCAAAPGAAVEFLTAVAVMRRENRALIEFTDVTRVIFRVLDQSTIERYIAKEQPLDCAGGFKSEGLGISLCESIDSADPSALIGLPLIRLSAALRAAGFDVP